MILNDINLEEIYQEINAEKKRGHSPRLLVRVSKQPKLEKSK